MTLATTTQDLDRLPNCIGDILGVSPAVESLRRAIAAAAGDDAPVLIAGEHGAGLSLVARTIHQCGRRRWRPFVCLDCSLHSAESLDRELFGGESHEARLQQAAGGTLCLENVDALPSAVRRKLLRLADGTAAGPQPTNGPGDVRLVATTHAPPVGRISNPSARGSDGVEPRPTGRDAAQHLFAAGRVIFVAPLRERQEDIGLVAEHFLHRVAVREGRPAKQLTLEALHLLRAHLWPGNLRELKNVVERACALDDGPRLTGELIRPWLSGEEAPEGGLPGLSLKDMERKLIETTFARCRGNRERTAQILGIGIRTLSGKLREYGYPPRGGPGSNRPARQRDAA